MSKEHPSRRTSPTSAGSNDDDLLFRPLLDEVRDAAKAVNAVADRASARIGAMDRALAEAGVGLEAWYAEIKFYDKTYYVDDDQEIPYANKTILVGYGKVAGAWGLALKTTDEEDGEIPKTSVILLRDADRESRIRALGFLPGVLSTLTRALREHKSDLENKLGAE